MIQNTDDSKEVDAGASLVAAQSDHWPRVLIAEDDDEMRRLLVRVLHADGYAVAECRNGMDLFSRLEPFVFGTAALDFDAIVSDMCMPGLTGLEILEDLHNNKGFPPMILITAFGDKEIHVRAEVAGAAAVLDKPFVIETLLAKLHEIAPQ